MAALHILVADTKNDRDWLINAAKRGNRGPWRVPQSAERGDNAVIYVGTNLLLTAQITRRATRVGRRVYHAPLDSIQLIRRPISIDDIKKSIPGLKWANYPRTYTTPSPAIAEQIRGLIRGAGGHAHLNGDNETADIEAIFRDPRLRGETSRKAMIDARLGQGRFRADLIERWNGACAVTRCRLRDILKASHIKPWKISNNRERLDPSNGLLLIANIDALFDSGLVTFDNNGRHARLELGICNREEEARAAPQPSARAKSPGKEISSGTPAVEISRPLGPPRRHINRRPHPEPHLKRLLPRRLS